jgi:ABC-2 type transport system ATP-binding protein
MAKIARSAVRRCQEGHSIRQPRRAGVATGRLSDSTQALLAASGPTLLLNQLQAPTLLTQSITNGLFPLQQALDNAETILANPYGTPVKMIWYGAGGSLTADEFTTIAQATLARLDTYVAGNGQPANLLPAFQWFDEAGGLYASSLLPFEAGFNDPTPISASAAGGTLTISPGTAPVTMISVPLANVVYTNASASGSSLTLQLLSAATAFANPSSGGITLSDITLDLPSRGLPT